MFDGLNVEVMSHHAEAAKPQVCSNREPAVGEFDAQDCQGHVLARQRQQGGAARTSHRHQLISEQICTMRTTHRMVLHKAMQQSS